MALSFCVLADKGTSGTAQNGSEGGPSLTPAAANKAADKGTSGIAQNKSGGDTSLWSTAVNKVLAMGTPGTVQKGSEGDTTPQADASKTPPSVMSQLGRDTSIPGLDLDLNNSKTVATGSPTPTPTSTTFSTQGADNANYNTGNVILNGVQSLVKGFNVVQSFGGGVGDAGVSAISGVVHMALHPILTGKAIGTAAAHPILTGKAIGNSVSEAYTEQVVNGDANSKAKFFGRAIGDVGLSLVGTKGR